MVLTLEAASQSGGGAPYAELAKSSLRFVVAPGSTSMLGVIKPQDLEHRTFLLAEADGAFSALLSNWLGGGRRPVKVESAGSIDGVKRGVLDCRGIGVLPDYAVAHEISAGALSALNIKGAPSVSLRLATRQRPQAGSALEALADQLRHAWAT